MRTRLTWGGRLRPRRTGRSGYVASPAGGSAAALAGRSTKLLVLFFALLRPLSTEQTLPPELQGAGIEEKPGAPIDLALLEFFPDNRPVVLLQALRAREDNANGVALRKEAHAH